MISFFGERWDAPRLDNAVQVATPVGQTCYVCTEQVFEEDRGLMVAIGERIDGVLHTSLRPVHAECELLSICGHTFGICSCTGYDTTSRSAALLLWERMGQARGRDLGEII